MAASPTNPPPAYQPAAPQYAPGVEVKQQSRPTAHSYITQDQAYQANAHRGAYGQPRAVVVTQQQTQPTNGCGSSYYSYIPCLPMGAAVVVLIFNIIGVGLGTILGGFFLLCCGHPYSTKQSTREVFGGCLVIGFGLMAFTFFATVGWFVAVYWGILFIIVSNKHYGRPFNPDGVTSTTNLIAA